MVFELAVGLLFMVSWLVFPNVASIFLRSFFLKRQKIYKCYVKVKAPQWPPPCCNVGNVKAKVDITARL